MKKSTVLAIATASIVVAALEVGAMNSQNAKPTTPAYAPAEIGTNPVESSVTAAQNDRISHKLASELYVFAL